MTLRAQILVLLAVAGLAGFSCGRISSGSIRARDVAGITLPDAGDLLPLEMYGEAIRVVRLYSDHRVEFEGQSFAPGVTGAGSPLAAAFATAAATMRVIDGIPDESFFLAIDEAVRWGALQAVIETACTARVWKFALVLQRSSAWQPHSALEFYTSSEYPPLMAGGGPVQTLRVSSDSSSPVLVRYETNGVMNEIASSELLVALFADRRGARLDTFVAPDSDVSWAALARVLVHTPHGGAVFYGNGGMRMIGF